MKHEVSLRERFRFRLCIHKFWCCEPNDPSNLTASVRIRPKTPTQKRDSWCLGDVLYEQITELTLTIFDDRQRDPNYLSIIHSSIYIYIYVYI